MRARNIKPSLFKNELLGAADPLLTILFEGLWCESDRAGRLEDRPARIRAEVFPYRPEADIEAMLCWLHDNQFIFRYVARGLKVIQIMTFSDHQRPHTNEVGSTLPTIDEADITKVKRTSRQGKKGLSPKTQALCSDPLFSDSGSLIPDSPSLIPDTRAVAKATPPPGLDLSTWERWKSYRQQIKKPIKPPSIEAAMVELAKYADLQAAVVQQSIAQGWTGLFEPKTANGSGSPIPSRRPAKTLAELEAEEVAANAQH
jgi:hypothetical protein